MEGLFNLTSILWHIANAIILLIALYFLLYKPVRKFMAKRTDSIGEQLQSAKNVEEKANEKMLISEQKLRDADHEAQSVIAQSAQHAQEHANQILASAHKETEEIVNQAKLDVDAMVVSAHQSMADEAAALAVEIASKMLAREVKLEDHKQLVDEFVKKVG